MFRGTTPNIVIHIPDKVRVGDITALKFMMSQDGTIVLTKTLDDFSIDGQTLSYRLSIDEANDFSEDAEESKWQIRGKMGDIYFASKECEFAVHDVLDGGAKF